MKIRVTESVYHTGCQKEGDINKEEAMYPHAAVARKGW